jgi:hypothetical protein
VTIHKAQAVHIGLDSRGDIIRKPGNSGPRIIIYLADRVVYRGRLALLGGRSPEKRRRAQC